jgi:hypothetical protein
LSLYHRFFRAFDAIEKFLQNPVASVLPVRIKSCSSRKSTHFSNMSSGGVSMSCGPWIVPRHAKEVCQRLLSAELLKGGVKQAHDGFSIFPLLGTILCG